MANTKDQARPRFAPVPIETTFERYRKTFPNHNGVGKPPTPEPSPRLPSPPPRGRRRFAPQLVESSVRRSRRVGDEGPATLPTDRTDITPYTNHIYAPKPRRKRSHGSIAETPDRQRGHARRESCDDEIAGPVFDLVARDAQKKLQDIAMSAFPNSGQRIGGAEHFYVREGSEDDGPRGRPLTRGPWDPMHSRRNSSEEDISWAFKEMREHAQMVTAHRRRDMSRIDTMDLDKMSIDVPLTDAIDLTSKQRSSIANSPLWRPRPSSDSLGAIGEVHMSLLRAESPLPTIGESHMPYLAPDSPPIRPIGETFMPFIPSAPAGKAGDMPYAPASRIPPETSFGHHAPFNPYGQERDMSLERARAVHRLRLKPSPPMLGQDLKFRMCPSPKQTKLEPDHLWDLETGTTLEDQHRDPTEQHGLWRGYCYTRNHNEKIAHVDRPLMITTPLPDPSNTDPFDRAFGTAPANLSEEPTPMGSRADSLHFPGGASIQLQRKPHSANGSLPLPEHRTKNNAPKGLHMLHNLHNLDEKLKQEKAMVDLEEKIAAEFDDKLVTQVYNYLSLGYPATARLYDEELSKISRIPVEDLEMDDDAIMENLWGTQVHGSSQSSDSRSQNSDDTGLRRAAGKRTKATGHIMLDSEEQDNVREEDRCPRWKALKRYIYEWARQHPDLNAISPLAWGVRERRGSWGI
ncbi:hypothetical protein QBC40DRAFT_21792 [Triangularia verruculosa]|uniref:Uncharacterized protein n=1 Tax=Triangularia verruculosa TaxID=2587418 RepID=A0AAN7AQH0_9PEZI|nr:hypothetical protein QBC40DRAFT_21792 [Triangularia verruculosa]